MHYAICTALYILPSKDCPIYTALHILPYIYCPIHAVLACKNVHSLMKFSAPIASLPSMLPISADFPFPSPPSAASNGGPDPHSPSGD